MDPLQRRLLGYTSTLSAAPGETVEFRVSSPDAASYDAALVRMRCADGHPAGPGFKAVEVDAAFSGRHAGHDQPIGTGSWARIPDAAALLAGTFTLDLLVFPTTPGAREQVLFACGDARHQTGLALLLDERGCPTLHLGAAGAARQRVSTDEPLLARHWYRLAISVDPAAGECAIIQLPQFSYARGADGCSREVALQLQPVLARDITLAAWLQDGLPRAVYNGRIEAPRIRTGVLGAGALLDTPDVDIETRAQWDFSRNIDSADIVDIAGTHHGHTVNLPTRAVCGAAWDGTEHNFTTAPHPYGAIHFHEDDLYDCGWDTDFSYTVPDDLPGGLYAARLIGPNNTEYLPFWVRPPTGKARARLALLIPTASYLAYANLHGNTEWVFGEQLMNAFTTLDAEAQYLHHHPEIGISTYDCHTDGSGGCYSSHLRPIVNMRPHTWAWQFVADTHITDWLEEKGFEYDVFTDEELHAEGAALLSPYTCVMTGTHPEYYSRAMMNALLDYQHDGGRFMYMGANGFYWKIDYHPDFPGAIEIRRAEDGSRGWLAEPGEYGQLGGLWRRNGIAPQKIAGSGFTAQGFDMCSHYQRTPDSFDPRAAFIFEGVGADEIIGNFGAGGGAAGREIDRADTALGTPPHALVVASATEFSVGYHWVKEEFMHAHAAITGETCPLVRADMVFYETPNGGAVFSTSSIAWAGALASNGYDNNVSRITENVLRRFLDTVPFEPDGHAPAGTR